MSPNAIVLSSDRAHSDSSQHLVTSHRPQTWYASTSPSHRVRSGSSLDIIGRASFLPTGTTWIAKCLQQIPQGLAVDIVRDLIASGPWPGANPSEGLPR